MLVARRRFDLWLEEGDMRLLSRRARDMDLSTSQLLRRLIRQYLRLGAEGKGRHGHLPEEG